MTVKSKNMGFSLMELIVVIAIIAILVTIMFPSISAFRKRAYKAKSIGAFQELSNAALQFKNATEYYPGQKENLANVTGSQALAICLLGGVEINSSGNIDFTDDEGTVQSTQTGNFTSLSDSNAQYIKSDYIEYSTDRFMEIASMPLTPSDLWKSGEEMAILYFPAQLGNNGETISSLTADENITVFKPNINSVYGDSANMPTTTSDLTVLKDTLGLVTGKFGDNEVKKSDSFLLIAPSLDREYFTEDDIKNY